MYLPDIERFPEIFGCGYSIILRDFPEYKISMLVIANMGQREGSKKGRESG